MLEDMYPLNKVMEYILYTPFLSKDLHGRILGNSLIGFEGPVLLPA